MKTRYRTEITKSVKVILTFIYVRRQPPHKNLTGEALDALPVLMGETVWGSKDSWNTLIAVAIVEEIVVNREKGGAAWWGHRGKVRTQQIEKKKSLHKHIITSC